MNLKPILTCLFCCLPLWTPASWADPAQGIIAPDVDNIEPPSEESPWYQVNVVIFRQPGHLLQSEQWKPGDEVVTQLPSNLVALEEATANLTPDQAMNTGIADETMQVNIPPAFVTITPNDEEFMKTLNRLNRSSYYDILFQKSWLQPGLDSDSAIAVLIQAGEVYDGLYELEGTTRLHVSRYLHCNSHLWLSKYVQQIEVIKPWWQENTPVNDTADQPLNEFSLPLGQSEDEVGSSGAGGLALSTLEPMDTTLPMSETITRYKSIRTSVMKESRRMRSGELHYLDHPLFGVIVKVVPYFPEPPDLPEETEAVPENPDIALAQ